jgi:hypothetical protein
VGAAIIFVFDRRNPPPPGGTAATPVNFGVVTGDALFASEPRNPGASTYCPDAGGTETITASAPFTISPVAGGEYVIQSFYDYTGDFLPTFKFRNLPEKGDIGGGVIDTAAALDPANASNPNFLPTFLPVDVGVPRELPDDAGPAEIPNFDIPGTGWVTDNVTVTLGSVLPSRRPYFYAVGETVSFDSGTGALSVSGQDSAATPPAKPAQGQNPNYQAILSIPQDIQVLASPLNNMDEGSVNNFESRLPHLLLNWGLPKAEYAKAIAPPFHFQLAPQGQEGFAVWQNALFDATSKKWVPQDIPEGSGVPSLWPLVVLTKLIDDPMHTLDPASLTSQGSRTQPVVVLQGITLLGGDGLDSTKPDSLVNTGTSAAFGNLFDTASGLPTVFVQDHLTVLVRPAAICFDALYDANNLDKRGTIVTPNLVAPTADLTNPGTAPIVPASALTSAALASLVKETPVQGCLPVGRYAINVVYPTGQAWTVPNESGACVAAEGATNYNTLSCTLQPRPVLYSQGTRAVVEITKAKDSSHCAGAMQVPAVCLPVPGTQ